MVKLLLGYDELTVVPVTVTKPKWTSSLPRPLTDSCTSLAPCTQVRDNLENIHTGDSHTPNPNVYDTHTTEVLSGKHQSHSGPTLPSTWAHCHAHSLRAAARCQLHVPTSVIIIWKIHTQGLHTPPPQTYTIPIMTEVLSGKYQSQSAPPSAPTQSNTWAHCHAHAVPSSRSRGHTSTTDRPVHTGAARTTGHNAPPCSPDFHPKTATTIPGSGIMLGTLTKPNVGEHTQDTTHEFQWRQTNCACAFYCVNGQIQSFPTHHYINMSHMYSRH